MLVFDILNEIFTEQIRSTIFKRVFEMRVNHVKDKRWEILRIFSKLQIGSEMRVKSSKYKFRDMGQFFRVMQYKAVS